MGIYTVYSLENCPYSEEAESIFMKSTSKFNIKKVKQGKKHKYKGTKANPMESFPQIYYSRKGDSLIIGGLSDFKTLMESQKIKLFKDPKEKKTLDALMKSLRTRFT